ncbi:MAG: haloacid dehalogenase, partial [Desulfobacterales bacterium]
MIDPSSLAFDIDGVFADTMTLFLDIAREEYKIFNVNYEDITCYTLEECIDIDPDLIETILIRIMNGTHRPPLKPIEGATRVLTRLSRMHTPILFVTARPHGEPIYHWIQSMLHLDGDSLEVVATGSFDAKIDVLSSRDISYFVEDRLETCYSLFAAGMTPILFKQPWNRK